MRIDRKFLLILPAILLAIDIGGVFYAASRLRQIVAASDNWQTRNAYIVSVQAGQRTITNEAALQLVRLSLDAEAKRSAAIVASHDLLQLLAWIGLVSCSILLWTIRGVPREAGTG